MKFTWMKWSAWPVAVLMAAAWRWRRFNRLRARSSQRRQQRQHRRHNPRRRWRSARKTNRIASPTAYRAANGRKPTTAEKKQINGQQNQVCKQIYSDKHNAKTQPQSKPKP